MANPSDLWRVTRWLFNGSPRKQVRIGPVFNFESDWETGRRRCSILLGLYSSERDGLTRRGRILWFIPWRRTVRPGL